jgi:hypothetical protein
MKSFEIGQKVRIIKCCAPFFGRELLGKVEIIKEIINHHNIHLERGLNVHPNWIELVDNDAVDVYMELNENTIQQKLER